jgi:alpha-1,3/alpha-1,6-mannosyltransferase
VQVPAVIPLLRLAVPHVVFYGHFPDLLLAEHSSSLRRVYRAPFDILEHATTAAASRVLVNSYFTRGVYADTFGATSRAAHADVLYPCVQVPADDVLKESSSAWRKGAARATKAA